MKHWATDVLEDLPRTIDTVSLLGNKEPGKYIITISSHFKEHQFEKSKKSEDIGILKHLLQ